MDQETTNKRFREVIAGLKTRYKNLKNKDFAAKLGISPPSISQILNGTNERNVTTQVVNNLCHEFPEVNKAYILGVSESGPFLETYGVSKVSDLGQTTKLPYIRATAFASFVEATDLNNYIEREYIELPVSLLVSTKKPQIVFDMYGDSMYPTLKSGSKVLGIEVAYQDIKYISSGIYAVVYGDQFVVKRVKDNDLLTDGTLTLHSDNTAIAGKVVIPQDRIRAVWKVHKILNQDVE